MRKLVVLSAFIAVILGSTYAYGADNDKYQDLFYPNGMPVKEGVLRPGQTFYEYYSEAEVSEYNLLFVLYSERIEGDPYDPRLAVLQKTGSSLKIISTVDVSDYAFTSADDQEFFNQLSGKLEVIPLKDNIKLLHLSIGGEAIPGAGHSYRSNSSDVFFRIDTSKNKLLHVLELLDTSPYEDIGEMSYEKYSNTFIYMQKDKKTGTKILTQQYEYENNHDKDIHTSILDPHINVYTYDFEKNRFSLSKKITRLPSTAIAIRKVLGFGIQDPNEEIGYRGDQDEGE